MLKLAHLKKYYNTQKAVDDISLEIPAGNIFGLLGPNGAGKSSLLRMITGITRPDSGEILINSKPYQPEIHNSIIGYMPEERGLYKKMKVGEQAIYLARLKGMSHAEASKQIKFWFDKLDMQSWYNKKVEDLSKGMSQKLQFVITVLHQPKLLILDEPFSGLDPVNSEVLKQEIFNLAKNGTTIIFSTHRMEQVEEICEEIALINKGKIILFGQVKDIKQQYKLNQYRLVVDKSIDGFENFIIQQNQFEYIFQFNEPSEANKILKSCLDKQIRIIEFQEILPSLNEIFIREVEGDAERQFENQLES